MILELQLYNTLSKQVEPFKPMDGSKVGIYWCGPTTYAPAHLGSGRSAVILDILTRYLHYKGYKTRTVRNITDVGHLLGDRDEGEDKVMRTARLQAVSPMEVAQHYTNSYRRDVACLNTLPPSIEPLATGHITQQIALIERLLTKGFAYVVNGSVYFDVPHYHERYGYGRLSARRIEGLLTGTRVLAHATEKRSPLDFALWKRAAPDHLMRWPSPWGEGFPGWHLECTAMGHAYLGTPFDIHGGGMDLCFPHHECEYAQSQAAYGEMPARYWMHHNLVTIAGRKMSKSADNFITLAQCFTGTHPHLSYAYHPMALRILFLQAHYRSTIDVSDHALQSAQTAYYKLVNGYQTIARLVGLSTVGKHATHTMGDTLQEICAACDRDMAHDLNTPKVIAHLFELLKHANQMEKEPSLMSEVTLEVLQRVQETYTVFLQDILGIAVSHTIDGVQLVDALLEVYADAKRQKNYAQVDRIREVLKDQGVRVQDRLHTIEWQYCT